MIVSEIFEKTKQILQAASIENFSQEADILFEQAMGKRRFAIEPDYTLSDDICKNIINMAQKRATHYPLQYICGSWPFMNIELCVGDGVLIPRGDTEIVCEQAISEIQGVYMPTVLDLCSGTGAIALSIKNEIPTANVTAVEYSPDAYKYLCLNGKHYLKTFLADVFCFQDEIEDGEFNLIVSNPPYVTKSEMAKLQTELFYEPRMALTDEGDGLKFYQHIAKAYHQKLKPYGSLVFEIGFGQAKDVCKILQNYGYTAIKVYKDYAGLDRCIVAKK